MRRFIPLMFAAGRIETSPQTLKTVNRNDWVLLIEVK